MGGQGDHAGVKGGGGGGRYSRAKVLWGVFSKVAQVST